MEREVPARQAALPLLFEHYSVKVKVLQLEVGSVSAVDTVAAMLLAVSVAEKV